MHDSTDVNVPVLRFMYLSNYGMPHLGYLGQMLEKGGGFSVGIFPEGLVLSQDCLHPNTHMLPCHTVCNKEI